MRKYASTNMDSISTLKKANRIDGPGTFKKVLKNMVTNKYVYLMMLPALIYYILHEYWPMYGAIIAFKNYMPGLSIMESPWVGLKHFQDFFNSPHFFRVFKNTFLISFFSILWGFPAPIIFALFLNEIKSKLYKRSIQTFTYMPHFISTLVLCGIIVDFTTRSGLINDIIVFFGGTRDNLLMKPGLFRTIYISSDIWQNIGWGSIIYLSAIANIDPQLYEASKIDGANRFKQLLYVTIPGLMPTIIILLILRIGQLLSVGFDKILLLYSPLTYETADVISTFVYRRGILEANYSFSAAVGLFNTSINFVMLVLANKLSKKYTETSLW